LRKQGLKPIEEVIDEVPIEEWQFWEQHYISLYKSWGFNLVNWTIGGEGGGMKGKKHSAETRRKQSESRKGYIDTAETKLLKAKAKIGNKNAAGPRECIVGSKHHGFIDKPVEQRDRYTNEVIKVWPNAFEAAQFYKQKWSSEIHFCCRTGKVRLGYRWSYQDGFSILIKNFVLLWFRQSLVISLNLNRSPRIVFIFSYKNTWFFWMI
jgi:hypothetical protein